MTTTDAPPASSEVADLADALWDGVRYYPPIPTADQGLRGWYLSGPYAEVVRRRRERSWRHRSGEPWLTLQWALDRAGGSPLSRADLRYEGFPGRHSYEDAYRRIARGQFRAPMLYVAGYSRCGTTSMQNLVLAAFSEHVPEGVWDGPGHPLRIWWYPKHDASVARRIADLDPGLARVVLCVRPFVEAAVSLALYTGFLNPDAVRAQWVAQQVAAWSTMTRVASAPTVVTVACGEIAAARPARLAELLASRTGLPIDASFDRDSSWASIYHGRISEEVVANPLLGNLPHAERPQLAERIRERIVDLIDVDQRRLEELYCEAVAAGS